MSDVKKPRIFIRNPDAGEPWTYAGDLSPRESLERVIGQFVSGEMDNDFGGQDADGFTIEIKRIKMTDAEIAAMPES